MTSLTEEELYRITYKKFSDHDFTYDVYGDQDFPGAILPEPFTCNDNRNLSYYTQLFWQSPLVHKEHKNFLGIYRPVGSIAISLLHDKPTDYYIAVVRTPLKFTTIKISGNMLKTSNASYIGKQIPSNSRHKILLYYILEKYLEKVEADIEILQEWEKETLGQTFKRTTVNRLPLTYSKTATFHPIEYNDVVVEISAKAFKHDLFSIVAKLEQVKEDSIIPVLKSLEAKLINKSFHLDVIFIDSDKSPELEETWDDFQAICGVQLELQIPEHIPAIESQFTPPVTKATPSKVKKTRTPEEMEKERKNAFYEIMETEKNHVKRLWSLMNTYVFPLRQSAESGRHVILRKYHLNKIFTNIESVIKIHEEFLEDLKKLEENELRGLGKVFLHNLTKFGPIKSYVLDYPSALKHSNTLAKSEASYRDFLKRVLEDPNCLDLPELLGTPCQRISKYIVLFDILFSNTSQQHPDYRPLKKAHEQLKEIAGLYESPDSESVKVLHQLYRIIDDCPPDIISASRKFITQFVVQEVDFTVATPLVQLTLFLFTDRLLVARAKSQDHLLGERKKPYEFVGWISLVGLSWYEMDSLAQTGFYIHAHAEYVEDEYWIVQRLRSFISPNVKEKDNFRLQLEAAKAITKTEKTNAIPFHLQHRGADIYLNIYRMEDYKTSKFKNQLAIVYIDSSTKVDDTTIPIQGFDSFAIGILQASNFKYRMMLKCKADTSPPTCDLATAEDEAISPSALAYQSIEDFRITFFDRVLQTFESLKNSVAHASQQLTFNDLLLGGLEGRSFHSKNSILSKAKSITKRISHALAEHPQKKTLRTLRKHDQEDRGAASPMKGRNVEWNDFFTEKQ